jgi:aspartyl-tRNA(Asn)/glutamyl-tRNA(Gln) amidotransferase subunit A
VIALSTIADLAPHVRSGAVAAVDLVSECLGRIERHARLNAFISVSADAALAEARQADVDRASGRYRGPLHGIPISLKDLIDVAGMPTTAASELRRHHVADEDAPLVARLRRAGAIVVGKCNLHEFAFGTTSEESAWGPVRHPDDPARSAGGSSGGSAVAVATGMSLASIGTDTGGSIRIPAAACGIVGLKPGRDEVPTGGVVPLSRTLDHVGPLTRSVADAWMVFQVLCSRAPNPTIRPLEPRAAKTLTIGVPRPYFFDLLEDDVRAAIDRSLEALEDAGVRLVDVAVPHAPLIASVYLHLVLPEASAYHRRTLDAQAELYTPAVRQRLEMGGYVLAEDYVRAMQGRDVLRAEVNQALRGLDALALPTLPIEAPRLGQGMAAFPGRSEPIRNVMLRLTQLFNVTGNPAVTLPCGRTRAGLPCGLQLVGRSGGTPQLLAAAAACERYLGLPGSSGSGSV